MNRLFIALDADNAGSKVGQAVLTDDVASLHEVSKKIDAGTKAVKDMVMAIGGQIISSGGDEMTAFIDPVYENRIEEMRARYKEISGFSASMGSGYTLSQAGKALIAAKLSGKDKHLPYSDEVEDILLEAHEANMAGTASPEQEKMDDHYIADTMGDYSEDMSEDEEYVNEDFDIDDQDQPEMQADQEDEMFSEQDESEEDDLHSLMSDPMEGEEEEEEEEEEEDNETFEEEDMVELPVSEDMELEEGMETEKADEQMEQEVLDEEAPDMSDESDMVEGSSEDLESDLSDEQFNEDILQRVASNLAAFKQNKELMDQIKESHPDLYLSMLNLIQNMIEMARMISPSVVGGPAEPQPDDMEESSEEDGGALQMQMSESGLLDPKRLG